MTALTVGDLLLGWRLDPAPAVVAIVVAGLYAVGVRRLATRGRHWHTGRSLAMAGAVAAGVLATQSGIGRYEGERFWVHMIQHVLIGVLVPLLVVLAAPLTLVLQSGAPGTRSLLRRALRSRTGHLVSHPLVGWALFGGGLVGLYLTPALDLAARNDVAHAAMHTHVVLAGVLFLAPLVGVDPVPARLPFAARLLAVLAAVPFHAVVALALLTGTTPVAPDAYPSLSDQRSAAAIFWGAGELLTVVVAGIVGRQWWVSERRAAAREDRALDAARLG
ncbi:MAG TPA: cytochrome c oxidase assembly protein [Acidimicrobiales bacterium]|nr:cytochrome c oxidase assembly protein [Acidimicrobiales bacterium]